MQQILGNLEVKIAKYGMFAPETAKAMGKCGSWCITQVSESTQIYKNLGSSASASINKFENSFNAFHDKYAGNTSIWKTKFNTILSVCGYSIISTQSIPLSRDIICKVIANHATQKFIATVSNSGYLSLSGGHLYSVIKARAYDSNITKFYDIVENNSNPVIIKFTFRPKPGTSNLQKIKTTIRDEIIAPDGTKIKS